MNNITNKTTLKVTDFGPIGKAEIDLRPLTVFLGPSNAGKSYLAILIYTLHRSLSESTFYYRGDALFGRQSYIHLNEMLFDSEIFKKTDIDELTKWSKDIDENINIPSSPKSRKPHIKQNYKFEEDSYRTIIISDTVFRLLRQVFESKAGIFTREVSRCFAMKPDDLKRKHCPENPKISINYQASVDSVMQSFNLFFNPVEEKLKSNFSEKFKIVFNEKRFKYFTKIRLGFLRRMSYLDNEGDNEDEMWRTYYTGEFFFEFANIIHLSIMDPFCYPAHYLPAGRTGIMHTHNVVVSSLVKNATKSGNRHGYHAPTLSGVSADFIEGLISINDHIDSRISKDNDHTIQIEGILEGKVHIEHEEVSNYPRFTYQPEGWTENLSLMKASSMVSELAPVIFYLRYKVHPGNILIIEEPESHLHPEKQVEFINALAGLIDSGIRVILTTHSQWIIEGLSNVVQRSLLATSEQESSKDEIALNPEMVGLWLFKKNAKTGSTVEEIKFDDNMYTSDFGVVAKDLYNDWVELINNGGKE